MKLNYAIARGAAAEDDEQTVIASGKDLKTTLTLSKKHGNEHPIVFRVPDEIVDFVTFEKAKGVFEIGA